MRLPEIVSVALAVGLVTGVGAAKARAQTTAAFDGMQVNLGNLFRTSPAQTRSISAENLSGEKGRAGMATKGIGENAARELGRGWKVSPFAYVEPNKTCTLAEINGEGAIQQIWIAGPDIAKDAVLHPPFLLGRRDGAFGGGPMGDLFACGWGKYAQVSSLAVCVNPGSGLSCHWTMPFRKKARITVQSLDDHPSIVGYQVNYVLTKVPADAAYFHAQFRRVSKLPCKSVYTILDGVHGRGQYVGTYLAWEVRSPGWWGEGEVKFYLDGDKEFPTICGTGTEDYFCGAYNFENQETHRYQTFSTPYTGLPQVLPADRIYVPVSDSGSTDGTFRTPSVSRRT